MSHFNTFFLSLIFIAFSYLGTSYAQLQRPLKASEIKTLRENIRKNPNNVQSRLFLGNHYYNQNQWRQVVEYLGPVAENLPDSEIYKLANSYLKRGDYRESEAIANILLSRNQVKTSSYLLAVEIYSKILDEVDTPLIRDPIHTRMFETLKTVQSKDPENRKVYDIWLNKLEAYVDHFAFEALRVMDDMKKNKIRMESRHYSLLCKYNFLAEFTKETKISCKKAIMVEPENPSNYIYLGQTHVNIGEEQVGKRMLASVGKKFSESEEALYAAADSFHQSGNIAKAFQYYQKAANANSSMPEVYLGLAQTAFDLKKYGVALQAFSKHCYYNRELGHEFRRASGLLKDQPRWQELYRQRMLDCKPPGKPTKK